MSDLNTGSAGADTVILYNLQGSSVHEMGRILADARQYRITSATVTLEPVVSRDVAGYMVAVLLPYAATFKSIAEIRNAGGVKANLTSKLVVPLQSAKEEYVDVSNPSAYLYYAFTGTPTLVVTCSANLTMVVRGKN
jgi:hypothetical protein